MRCWIVAVFLVLEIIDTATGKRSLVRFVKNKQLPDDEYNLPNMPLQNIADEIECCHLCGDNTQGSFCTAFMYETNRYPGRCWLKNLARWQRGWEPWPLDSRGWAYFGDHRDPVDCDILYAKQKIGDAGMLPNMPIRDVSNYQECYDLCGKHPHCTTWQYDNTFQYDSNTDEYTQAKLCYLYEHESRPIGTPASDFQYGWTGIVSAYKKHTVTLYFAKEGYEIPGADLEGTPENAWSMGECCQICARNTECTSWTFETNVSPGRCWLKNHGSSPKATANNNRAFGELGSHHGLGICDLYFSERNLPGGDLPGMPLADIPTQQDCHIRCKEEPRCTSWVYDTKDDSSCWLKTYASLPVLSKDPWWRTTGLVVERTVVGSQPAANGPLYEYHSNENLEHGDLFTSPASNVEDITACCRLCASKKPCTSFVYDNNAELCWLKGFGVPKPTGSSSKAWGWLGPHTATGECELYHRDQELQNGDLPNMPIQNVSDFNACFDLCKVNAECTSWAYDTSTDPGNRCWLKGLTEIPEADRLANPLRLWGWISEKASLEVLLPTQSPPVPADPGFTVSSIDFFGIRAVMFRVKYEDNGGLVRTLNYPDVQQLSDCIQKAELEGGAYYSYDSFNTKCYIYNDFDSREFTIDSNAYQWQSGLLNQAIMAEGDNQRGNGILMYYGARVRWQFKQGFYENLKSTLHPADCSDYCSARRRSTGCVAWYFDGRTKKCYTYQQAKQTEVDAGDFNYDVIGFFDVDFNNPQPKQLSLGLVVDNLGCNGPVEHKKTYIGEQMADRRVENTFSLTGGIYPEWQWPTAAKVCCSICKFRNTWFSGACNAWAQQPNGCTMISNGVSSPSDVSYNMYGGKL